MPTRASPAAGDPATYPSFRLFLQGELAARCARNPRYSLRAFARRLEVDHSTLSQLLRGKRRITPRLIGRCAHVLGLDAGQTAAAIVREGSPAVTGNRPHAAEVARVAEVVREAATVLSGWHHFAILELTRLDSFRPDSRWIAQVLGITADEVNIAIQRLVRMKLLEMSAPDRWSDLTGGGANTAHHVAHVLFARLTGHGRAVASSNVGASS